MQYIAQGSAQNTSHPYSLKTASIEQASVTQSNYNFSFRTIWIKVTSDVAAIAVLSGCEQQINDLMQSQSVTVTPRLTVGLSVLVCKYLALLSVGLREPSVDLAGLSAVCSLRLRHLFTHAPAHAHPNARARAHLTKNTASQLQTASG